LINFAFSLPILFSFLLIIYTYFAFHLTYLAFQKQAHKNLSSLIRKNKQQSSSDNL